MYFHIVNPVANPVAITFDHVAAQDESPKPDFPRPGEIELVHREPCFMPQFMAVLFLEVSRG